MTRFSALALAAVATLCVGCASPPPTYSEPATVYGSGTYMHSGPIVVRSYVKKDGTYVRAHTRRR